MKKTPLTLVLAVFVLLLFYLHQKVEIYTMAFQLSSDYNDYQDLASQKDCLRYDFAKRASLSSLSDWLIAEDFSAPERERLLVFRPRTDTEIQMAQERSFFERLRLPLSISDVFARGR